MKNKKLKRIFEILILLFILLHLSFFVIADSWTSDKPSHSTLYVDTITSKTDASSVNIADSQGLFVTGDVTTLGKVGIGTTAPSQKFHLSNGVALFNSGAAGDTNSGLRILAPIAPTHYNWMIGAQQNVNAGLEFTPSTAVGGTSFSTPVMTIKNDGNVGIGTASPGAKLHVRGVFDDGIRIQGDTSGSHSLLGSSNSAGTVNSFFGVTRSSNDGPFLLGGSVIAGSTTASPFIIGTNNQPRVYIDSNGNVGIGTTSPQGLFHISGGGSNAGLLVKDIGPFGLTMKVTPGSGAGLLNLDSDGLLQLTNTDGPVKDYELRMKANIPMVWGIILRANSESYFSNVLTIGTNGGATGNTKLAVFGGSSIGSTYGGVSSPNNGLIVEGNVGIGSTNPGAKQTILGGDVYVASQGNGIILKDNADGTCRRVILSGGSLSVSGVIACPSS